MIHVIASVSVRQGCRAEFLTAIAGIADAVRSERGCIEYQPAVDIDFGIDTQRLDPNSVLIVEKWESIDDLELHRKAPHLVQFKKKTKRLVKDMFIRVLVNP